MGELNKKKGERFKVTIEAASLMDEAGIKQLLGLCGLPYEDITPDHLRHFWVMKERGQIIGVIGLEVYGRLGLLRSLAVDPRYRNQGLASRLHRKAEEYAASLKIVALYLLTVTAEDFFANRGYQRIERNSAPPPVQETAEFQSLCPTSSVCMFKHFKAG